MGDYCKFSAANFNKKVAQTFGNFLGYLEKTYF